MGVWSQQLVFLWEELHKCRTKVKCVYVMMVPIQCGRSTYLVWIICILVYQFPLAMPVHLCSCCSAKPYAPSNLGSHQFGLESGISFVHLQDVCRELKYQQRCILNEFPSGQRRQRSIKSTWSMGLGKTFTARLVTVARNQLKSVEPVSFLFEYCGLWLKCFMLWR